MLYVFHGSDVSKGVEKAHSLITSLRAKRPDAAYEILSPDNWNPSILEGHLGGQGLFSNKYIVFLDRVTEHPEAKEQIAEFIAPMKESSNIFIVLEGKLLAELKKLFEKHAEKVVVCEVVAGSTNKKEFNIFSLADAVGNRDPFKAWSLYRQAVDAGVEAESIAGTLFWQIKSMMVARDAKTAGEAGLNPFVFGKAKKAAGNYSAEDLGELSRNIIASYHDGHRGICNIELTLERCMLSLKLKE